MNARGLSDAEISAIKAAGMTVDDHGDIRTSGGPYASHGMVWDAIEGALLPAADAIDLAHLGVDAVFALALRGVYVANGRAHNDRGQEISPRAVHHVLSQMEPEEAAAEVAASTARARQEGS